MGAGELGLTYLSWLFAATTPPLASLPRDIRTSLYIMQIKPCIFYLCVLCDFAVESFCKVEIF